MNTKPKDKSGYLGVKLDGPLQKALRATAKREGMAVSAIVRIALRAYMNVPKAPEMRAS